MAKWADIITAHDRNLRNRCLHVELESIENEAIWTDTFNCNTIHILVSLSLVNWTVGQVSFDGLVSPSISIICFTEEGKSFFQIDSCVSVVPGQSIKEEKEPILQSQLLLYLLFFHLKRVWNEIWSEIQIFNQFATFPLIFVYTSVIHLYCSHCAIQLFRSNCTVVSSGLFTGICCKLSLPLTSEKLATGTSFVRQRFPRHMTAWASLLKNGVQRIPRRFVSKFSLIWAVPICIQHLYL